MMSKPILLEPKDLNTQGGIYCPSPKAGMELWSAHPRVFLNVGGHHSSGSAKCPYCGTEYALKEAREHAAH